MILSSHQSLDFFWHDAVSLLISAKTKFSQRPLSAPGYFFLRASLYLSLVVVSKAMIAQMTRKPARNLSGSVTVSWRFLSLASFRFSYSSGQGRASLAIQASRWEYIILEFLSPNTDFWNSRYFAARPWPCRSLSCAWPTHSFPYTAKIRHGIRWLDRLRHLL